MRGRILYARTGVVYYVDGGEVSRDEFFAAFPPQPMGDGSGLTSWQKPIVSDALGVHPEQVEEATADAKAKGVPTEFLPDGRPLLVSRQHRKEYLRAYGFHDRAGGYGD